MEVKNNQSARADRTRGALLLHARDVFAEEGYGDASLDEIVRRAELTKGALYHHFGGKLDLYCGVVEEMAAELRSGVEEATATHDDPWRRIEAMCDAYLDTCLDSDLARLLVLEAPTVLGWRRWCEIDREHAFGAFAAALEEVMGGKPAVPGEDAGEAGTGDAPETAAQVLLGVLNTVAQVIATSADPDAARAEVASTVRRVLEGLRTGARAS